MKNFCLYNGKKIVKPETWNITSVELSSDYTSAIIQAESKSNKSEYTLDIIHLIENQYSEGSDSYITNTINSLTGATEWTFDNAAKVVRYVVASTNTDAYQYLYSVGSRYGQHITVEDACKSYATDVIFVRADSLNSTQFACNYRYESNPDQASHWATAEKISNPDYDPNYTPPVVSITYQQVTNEITSKAASGDTLAQNSIISIFNNITDDILTSDYSEFFEQNKQPK